MKLGAPTSIAKLYSPFYVAGNPGAAVAPTPGMAGEALIFYAGQIPYLNPAAGLESRLVGFNANCNTGGELWLCDRLWHNSGFSVTDTTTQTVNSVAWPPRDRDGLTDGKGVMIGVEVSTIMGAGTPTFTMGYTNTEGTADQSSVSAAVTSAMPVGYFNMLPLAAGDIGVQSIQTMKLSATMVSGVLHLVAFRVLAKVQVVANNVGMTKDAVMLCMPKIYDDTVPFFVWMPSTSTGPALYADVTFAHG